MSQITYNVSIYTADNMGSAAGDRLYELKVDSPFLPDPGEILMIEDGHGDVELNAYIKRRWFAQDGSVTVELVPWHLDPNESMQRHCDGKYRSAWWSDQDGDIRNLLEACGWTRSFPAPPVADERTEP